LQLSSRASDPYTADESHRSGRCSLFTNQTSTLQTLQISMYMIMLALFGFRNKRIQLANHLVYRVWSAAISEREPPKPGGFLVPQSPPLLSPKV
jgi:hypothetical protein